MAPALASPEAVVAAARGWIGTPYHGQASLRGVGCDCLGLARGVWREVVGPEPAAVPGYSRDWGERGAREVLLEGALTWMVPLGRGSIEPGALLLFRMREAGPAKHCGIVSAAGRFIHAYDRVGVVEAALSDPWRRRMVAVFGFPASIEALGERD